MKLNKQAHYKVLIDHFIGGEYMYLKYANELQKAVKRGDRVSVQGNPGIVTDVIKTNTAGDINIFVKVSFDNELSGTAYDNSYYGGFSVIK